MEACNCVRRSPAGRRPLALLRPRAWSQRHSKRAHPRAAGSSDQIKEITPLYAAPPHHHHPPPTARWEAEILTRLTYSHATPGPPLGAAQCIHCPLQLRLVIFVDATGACLEQKHAHVHVMDDLSTSALPHKRLLECWVTCHIRRLCTVAIWRRLEQDGINITADFPATTSRKRAGASLPPA